MMEEYTKLTTQTKSLPSIFQKRLRRAPQLTASLRKEITLFCGNGSLL